MTKLAHRTATLLLLTQSAWGQGGPGGPGGPAGDGIWRRSALYGEALTFDHCFAHQPGDGTYHNHVQPVCLRAQLNDNVIAIYSSRNGTTYQEKPAPWTHSPILGWSYDGFPVYGPYGYSDPMNPASPVQRMTSSYRLRNITRRTSLPDWSLTDHAGISQQLSPSQYGPDVSSIYPLGRYAEDYDYVAGLGTLDQFNGRFAITPDFPNGTYAYYVTLDDNGTPAFPFMIGMDYYGNVPRTGPPGAPVNVPAAAVDYFTNGAYSQQPSTTPQMTTFVTTNSQQPARATSGWDPSAGPNTTWPVGTPAGVQYSGGQMTPADAETQRIRFTADTVYVNANGLPGYPFGPWFDTANGGVFNNWPSAQNVVAQLPRNPAQATTHATTGGGPIGILVNGVAIFNALDQQSYSTSAGQDQMIPALPASMIVSAASFEGGPIAPGSLATAFSVLSASFSAGSTINVRDSQGVVRAAAISYISPGQANFRIPPDTAAGLATVTIQNGNTVVSGAINVIDAYPNIFMANPNGAAAAQLVRVSNGQQSMESPATPIDLGPPGDLVYLVLFGSGLGQNSPLVSATIGGVDAQVSYAGPQGVYAGVDQFNVLIPRSLAGSGRVDVVVTAGGKKSNPVNVVIE